MSKIIVSTFVSLDGVIENPMWSISYWNDEIAKFQNDDLFAADALLLGRETYESFAEAWPPRGEADAFTARINTMPKYVASKTLQNTTWNSTVIQGDVVEELAKLKQQPSKNLLKYGGGGLLTTLIQHKLLDELHVLLYPIIVGTGARLFPDGSTGTLQLTNVKDFKNGVLGLTYQLPKE